MARKKKIEEKPKEEKEKKEIAEEELKDSVKEPEPEKQPNLNVDMAKVAELKKTPEGKYCSYCRRNHEKSFDDFGINHEAFPRGGKAEAMFNFLVERPKKPAIYPFAIGEKVGAVATLQRNGLKINVLKGVVINVPDEIADAIAESQQQNIMATETVKIYNKSLGKFSNPKIELKSQLEKEVLE